MGPRQDGKGSMYRPRRRKEDQMATCETCGVKVAGHGVQAEGQFFCCAREQGMAGVSDRA